MPRTHAYIVGAGFSWYAGLPLQAEFTAALLEPRTKKSYRLAPLIENLGGFVHDVFDHKASARARFWPNLEDVFTNIDLAANTGHYLGATLSPHDLRTTRRVLIARMMSMLDERFKEAESAKTKDWLKLDKFFTGLDIKHSSFISINWDTVVERRLAELQNVVNFDYRCGAIPAEFPSKGSVVKKQSLADDALRLPLVKIHGSVNWLYCDNCRQLYWFSANHAQEVAMQLIPCEEGKLLGLGPAELKSCAKWHCLGCTKVPLTTRIATFSFLKALDFPMFEKSWVSAEGLLREAEKWVFIGYSLPAADYEFKHLLKRVQLSRTEAPRFVVITGGSSASVNQAYENYQRFFGRGIRRRSNFFPKGLSDDAIDAAHR